jgi:hypothetical protein
MKPKGEMSEHLCPYLGCIVHAPDKSKGHREQQIDISYDLVGILPSSLLNDLQNGETA